MFFVHAACVYVNAWIWYSFMNMRFGFDLQEEKSLKLDF